MGKNKRISIPFRRKLEGSTDYKKRMRILVSQDDRLVVRKGSRAITAQIVKYGKQGDRVMVTANSKMLRKYGWKYAGDNMPAAYLVGLLVGRKAKSAKLSHAILDMGRQKKVRGSRLFGVLKGALDSGLDVPHADTILPSEDRINGRHIESYANAIKKDNALYTRQFSSYIKSNADPSQISRSFEDIKKKILGE